MNVICPRHKIKLNKLRYSLFLGHGKKPSTKSESIDWYYCIKCDRPYKAPSNVNLKNKKTESLKQNRIFELRQTMSEMLQTKTNQVRNFLPRLNPYIQYQPNLHNYKVKVIIVIPSPYGDNLEHNKILEELI